MARRNSTTNAPAAPVFMIDDTKRARFADALVNQSKEVQGRTLREEILAFASGLPAAPVPEETAEAIADVAISKWIAAREAIGLTFKDEKARKMQEKAKRSAYKKAVRCAPLLESAYEAKALKPDQGMADVLKFCTVLQDAEFSVPKAIELINAEANKAKDFKAAVARHVTAMLEMTPTGDVPHCLTPEAKQELARWAHKYFIKLPDKFDKYLGA